MEYQEIRYEVAEGVLTLTLDRPDKLNAFNDPMHGALREAIANAEADSTCRALLVTSSKKATSSLRLPFARLTTRLTNCGQRRSNENRCASAFE